MKHAFLLLFCIVCIGRASGQVEAVVRIKKAVMDDHDFGVRAGIVAGMYNFGDMPDGFQSGIVPGFSIAGYYRYTRRRLMVMPEVSITREGGRAKGNAVVTDTAGNEFQGAGELGVVIYDFNIKALIGVKTRKGFMFYAGPGVALQMSGKYHESFKPQQGGTPYAYDLNVKMSKLTAAIPELVFGLGYDIGIVDNKYGVTIDLQFIQSILSAQGNITLPYHGTNIDLGTIKYLGSSAQLMVGFRF